MSWLRRTGWRNPWLHCGPAIWRNGMQPTRYGAPLMVIAVVVILIRVVQDRRG